MGYATRQLWRQAVHPSVCSRRSPGGVGRVVLHRSVPLQSGWSVVVLDTMDMSNHADCSSPEDAAAFIAAHPSSDFPQMALGRGFANGGIGSVQLAWLKRTLGGARLALRRLQSQHED